MFDKFKSMAASLGANGRQKSKSASPSGVFTNPYSVASTMKCYRNGSYDNNYPNITRIAERFAGVLPYAVDREGNVINDAPAIAALYSPNAEMSSIRFFKTLAVMLLVHPSVQILVWHKNGREIVAGGPITADNIAGFTFIEGAVPETKNGKLFYKTSYATYSSDEVITLSLDVNPYSVLAGYSPSLAAKKWSNIDDFIAEYQEGFFRNGAVPAGQFIITAATVDEFNKIVDRLQQTTQGASNNNGVLYVHKPVNAATGAPMNSQVEWIPFSQGNKDLSLHELFEQAEKVRDMNFGVPAEVKGYLQNSNYASANVAERVFDKYVVLPKLTQVWTDFTHELNRITGGLGYAITFDFDTTVLADEEKVNAETKQIQLQTLSNALMAGFSMESAIYALDLPKDFLQLQEREVEVETNDLVAEEGEEHENASQLETSSKIVGTEEKDQQLEDVISEDMLAQIEDAINGLDYSATEERDNKLTDDLLPLIFALMALRGASQFVQGSMLLSTSGYSIENLGRYFVSDAAKAEYRTYLQKVAHSYNEDTAKSIRKVLEQSRYLELSKEETATNLRNIMNTDEWRVQRLATTEVHRSEQAASLDAMEQIQRESGVQLMKTWHRNPYSNSCEDCKAMDGMTMPLESAFFDRGELFPSGREVDFEDVEAANGHPGCHCYLTYSIAPAKSVKVTCPKCKRYLFESKGGNAENVICGNSKCKRHFNFEIKNGQITSEEVKGGE